MLSNTAIPRYYGEFREQVLRGEIPVNVEISMEMNRIDKMIANPRYYYNDEAIDGFIKFCETELTLTDGSPMKLTPCFKLWAEELFGWYEFVQRSKWKANPDNPNDGVFIPVWEPVRVINKQIIIAGRGVAKTMYDECIQAYFLVVDPSTTEQITTAPTMRQADEVMSPFRTAITRAPGPLFKFLTLGSLQNTTGNRVYRQKLCSTKLGIQNFLTNSTLEVRAMTIDKLQGLRSKVNTVDEWLSGDTREDVIGAIEQGASKHQDWVIVATSSEGTVRNGPGDDIKLELMSILKGEYDAPHVSIWWYKLDSIDEVGNPKMWVKANPNLGRTVTYETYEQDVKKAEFNPSARNDILAKRFGLPMEGYTYFFTYEETLKFNVKREFWGMPCAMGVDLSQGDDFCAFSFLFPIPSGGFGLKVRSYMSSIKFRNLPWSLQQKYQEFLQEGTLIVMDDTILSMEDVYTDLDFFIRNSDFDVRCVGFDPYNAKGFIGRWVQDNGEYAVEKVIQGIKTESVPLGELKQLFHERQVYFDEALMQYCMGNAIVIEDTNGNRKLLKRRREDKIDNVASTMDALVAYKLHLQDFI